MAFRVPEPVSKALAGLLALLMSVAFFAGAHHVHEILPACSDARSATSAATETGSSLACPACTMAHAPATPRMTCAVAVTPDDGSPAVATPERHLPTLLDGFASASRAPPRPA